VKSLKSRLFLQGLLLSILCVPGPAAARKAGKSDKAAKPAAPEAPTGAVQIEQWYVPAAFQFRTLGVEDGLPQSQVFALIQSQRGFVWIGTQNGLARYDGSSFRVYRNDPNDLASISANHVTALAQDPKGGIWIGTSEAGLNHYDSKTDKFTRYIHDEKKPSSLASDAILALYVDGDGMVWIGTDGGGLNRLNPETGEVKRYELEDQPVSAIVAGEGKTILFGYGGELYDVDSAKGVGKKSKISEAPIAALHRSSDGTLWIGTKGDGLYKLDASGKKTHFKADEEDPQSLGDDQVNVIGEDSKGSLWIGTERGLNELPKGATRFNTYVTNTKYTTHSTYPTGIYAIAEDRGGVLWFGTMTGARRIDPVARRFNHFRIDDFTVCGLIDKKGDVWVGTYNEGLVRYNRTKQQATKYRVVRDRGSDTPIAFQDHWLTGIYEDKQGTIWVGGVGLGLVGFDPESETGVKYDYAPDDPGATINRLTTGPDGALWLATWGHGLVRFDPSSKRFDAYLHDDVDPLSISSNALYSVVFDRLNPKVVWLGTAGGGLSRFDLEAKTAKNYVPDITNPKGIGHHSVVGIHQEEKGTIWLGTYGGGLHRFDPNEEIFERFTTKQGLSNDQIYGVLADDEGRLWLSTNGGGVSVYDPAKKVFTNYNAIDGLQSDEFIFNGYFRAANGEMVFTGTKGFNVFHPSQIVLDEAPPPMALTSFRVKNLEAKLDSPIWTLPALDLSYRDSVFSFEYAALDFAPSSRPRYQYRLEGVHDDWIDSDRRFVTYSNLDGGDYMFQVRAAKRGGKFSDTALSIPVHVDPPPWKTWWAYTLYLLIIAAAAAAYLRYQQQRIKTLEQANRLNAAERDLELTGTIQTGFLPQENKIDTDTVKLVGYYRPADFASGDWWWYEIDGAKHAVLVGDVTGHGAGPAMVTAAVATAFRVQPATLSFESKLDIVNREVLSVGRGKYRMTLSAVLLDVETGKFQFYSAGGLPMVCVGSTGKARVVASRGTPLGTDSFSVGRVEGQLMPGERMLVFTDGIPEVELPNGRMLGMRTFAKLCENTRAMGLDDAVKSIIGETDKMRKPGPQGDDWTLAMVEWTATDVSIVQNEGSFTEQRRLGVIPTPST
jgi:ligand-binding sensor domain-containing protein/serine phosphatase RsbU (regulator of sigma subunit)